VQEVLTIKRQLEDYNGLISDEILSQIEKYSAALKGLRVIHINTTPQGGGVAEILNSLVPLSKSVGIDAKWYVMPLDNSFATITKSLHHFLQGYPGHLTDEQMGTYLSQNQNAALRLKKESIAADIWVLHDPQVLPLVDFLPDAGKMVWKCHIDTTEPNVFVRDSLMPFMNRYHTVIFSLKQYVLQGLSRPNVCIFAPAIDPLSSKNISLPITTIRQVLQHRHIDQTRPLITQVSRFDRWKDPWGVIDAYRIAKQSIPDLQLALIGGLTAQDDPDAQDVLHSVQHYAGDDADIHIFSGWSALTDLEVNAFQTASDIVVQKSIREGFGLTVAEAMWKGTPVIGGNCGGIRLQIRDGINGFLVSNTQDCADRIIALLRNPDLARSMGQTARDSVKNHFLITRLLRDHLRLYASLMA